MRLLLTLLLIPCVVSSVFWITVNADEIDDEDRIEDIERDSEYFDNALDGLNTGKYKTARRYFKKVLKNEEEAYLTDQEYAQARVGLAQVYQYLGKKDDVLELFVEKIDLEKLTEIDVEKNALLLNGYAQTLLYYGELESAEKVADALTAKVTDNEIFLETASEIAYTLGKNEKAKKLSDRINELVFNHKPYLEKFDKSTGDRNISNIYVAACKARYILEKIDRKSYLKEAFDYARKAVTADKRNVDALYWAAKVTLGTETHADARNLYLNKAREINDQHPGIAYLMMQTYVFEGEMFKAQAEVNALMQYLPDAEESLLAKIEMCNAEQNYLDVKSYIDKLLEINPKHLYGLSLKALNCLHLSDNSSFMEIEKQVLSFNKNYSNFYTPIVQGLVQSKNFDDAIKLGEKGLKIEEDNWSLHKYLGFAYAWQGLDEPKAYEHLKQANFNDTLRNKLYTINISQTLRVLKEEFTTQNSLDANFTIKLHNSAFEIMFPYIEDALMSDYKELTKKYGFKLKTPIVVEGFHRLDDFGSRTTGLPTISTFGESFGRLITLALPQAAKENNFSWRRIIRRELEKTFQIQMSRGCAPTAFLEGYTQFALTQYRSTWRMQNQYELVLKFYDDTLQKLSTLNLSILNTGTRDFSVFQTSLMMQMMIEKHGGEAIVKQMLEMFAQNFSLEQAINKISGLTSEKFDEEFKNYVKEKFVKRVKIEPRPGIIQLQKLMIEYEETKNAELKPQLAWAYFCNKMNAEAYQLAEDIYKQDNENKIALFLIGYKKLENAGANPIMQAEAQELLTKAEKNGLEDYELYVILGRLFMQDSPTSALEYYIKAVDSFPDFVGHESAYYDLLTILHANANMEQFMIYLEKFCSYTELELGARVILAKNSSTIMDDVSSVRWLRDIVEMVPHMNEIQDQLTLIHNTYANACENTEHWHEAGLEWRICLNFVKLEKMKAGYYLKSASAYNKAKEYDIALEMVAKAIEIEDTKEARDLKLTIELAKSKSKPE